MCAFFGPKNGDFQKMLRIVWNGEKCNKIFKKSFLGSIIYWYWIVSFLVLNILGIVNKNNPIMLRSLVGSSEVRQSQRSSGPYIFAWLFFNSIVLFCNFPALKWAVLKTIQKGKKKMSKWFSLVFRFFVSCQTELNRNFGIIQWILFSSVVHWSM